jgi:hypothetical protein
MGVTLDANSRLFGEVTPVAPIRAFVATAPPGSCLWKCRSRAISPGCRISSLPAHGGFGGRLTSASAPRCLVAACVSPGSACASAGRDAAQPLIAATGTAACALP